MSIEYTNPNTNPETLTTLTLTSTDHDETFEKLWTWLGFELGKLETDRAGSLTRY